MNNGFYRVVLEYACYGVRVKDNIIVYAAPIARWAMGKSLAEFTRWVTSKCGKIEKLPDDL